MQYTVFHDFCMPNMNLQDRQCTYDITLRGVFVTIFCHGRAISMTYSECVSVALVMQHAKCMCHVILSSVVSLALLYFSTLSH